MASTARFVVSCIFASVILIVCARAFGDAPGEEENAPPPSHAVPVSLIAGKLARDSHGVRRVEALTDGRAGHEGDGWKTHLSAVFSGKSAFAVYDLGTEQRIVAVWLQADANDAYDVEISRNGATFERLWRASPDSNGGLRSRAATDLDARGRYVRIRPAAGDGRFCLSELQLFSMIPPELPVDITRASGMPLDRQLRDKTLLFGLSLLVPLLLVRRGSSRAWLLGSFVLPCLGAASFVQALVAAWPVEPREVSLVRGTVAAVATVAVFREAFAPPRAVANHIPTFGVLGACALLALLAFYNLGHPQFYDHKSDTWTYAHHLDLRQYYPTAKYFPELGYRRLYEADIAAYAEDQPELTPDSVHGVPMRDLHSLEMSSVIAQQSRVDSTKRRFSEKRWEAYKRDARWFRESLGPSEYLATFHDYGGNATPVWITIAYGLFSLVGPSNLAFTLTGLVDLCLVLGMFVAVAKCFGPRTMLVSVIVFGANDFIMYGSNWAGATLRHDWLAYIGFGACALRREKWLLGGALLGLAAMIRAFPALCIIGACLPACWRIVTSAWLEKRLPRLRDILDRERTTFRIVLGASLMLTATVVVTLVVLPWDSWIDWLRKAAQLESDPHPASVALRSLLGGWESDQARVLRSRTLLYVVAIAFYIAMVVLACRTKRPDQAALLGLTLLPVLLYPANYYIHFVFLLPLVVNECREIAKPPVSASGAGVWLTLLVLCAAQYFTVLVDELPLHFYFATTLLFAALTALLVLLVREEVRAAGWLRT